MIAFNFFFVFFACPQMINDLDCNLFGVRDFGNAEIEDGCSMDYSDCVKVEGNLAVCLS